MGIFSWLLRELFGDGAPTPRGRRQRPIRHDPRRGQRPFHEERGWTHRGNTLYGYYRTTRGAFEGKVEKAFSKSPQFFVIRPPSAVVNGPHGPCFRQHGEDVFWVHFSPVPSDVNVGIMRIEHCIQESMR